MSDEHRDVNSEDTLPPNVTDIKAGTVRAGRKKKEKADTSEPQDIAAEIYETIFLALSRSPLVDRDYPLPDFRIEKVRFDRMTKPVLISGAGEALTAKELSEDEVANLIGGYIRKSLAPGKRKYRMTVPQVKQCAAYWLMHTEVMAEPEAFLFKSQPGIAWYRADFDPAPGACPLWEEFTGRVTNGNAEALEAFLGAYFVKGAYNQQYLWLQGVGNDSKGAFVRFFRRVLGLPNVLNLGHAPGEDRHESASIIRKLGLFYPDFQSYALLDNTWFLMLTGGDDYPVRPPGVAPYDTASTWRVIFTSNKFPNLTDSPSNQRRAIYVAISQYTESNGHAADYEARLYSEAGAIIHRCIETHRRLCPTLGPIPVSDESREMVRDQAAARDDRWALWMADNHLEFWPESSIAHTSDLLEPNVLERKIKETRWTDKNEIPRLRDYLTRKGVIRKTVGRAMADTLGMRAVWLPTGKDGKTIDKRPKLLHGIREITAANAEDIAAYFRANRLRGD